MPEATPRVVATDAARDLIATLRAKHGPLMFHQSGGCCDGSSPMCYALGEFMVGGADVLLGDRKAARSTWARTSSPTGSTPSSSSTPCPAAAAPSLDSAEGRRFLLRSRLYSDEEWANVAPVGRG